MMRLVGDGDSLETTWNKRPASDFLPEDGLGWCLLGRLVGGNECRTTGTGWKRPVRATSADDAATNGTTATTVETTISTTVGWYILAGSAGDTATRPPRLRLLYYSTLLGTQMEWP